MSYASNPRSNMWFLLPILLGVIGGIIAFFIIRKDDLQKAKKCLYLGFLMMIIGIILNIILGASISDIGSEFQINI